VASAIGAWPGLAVGLLKGTVAFPFVFHSLNGFRHLYMDVGAGFVNKQFIKSGWLVFGLSAIGTLYLSLIS
jgi:succinate dehydrogenase (ubiquinone) cytochrome b560 subunit